MTDATSSVPPTPRPAEIAAREPALAHLMPGWFATVLGGAGLALAWHRAEPWVGAAGGTVVVTIGALAAAAYTVLLVASVVRAARHPGALREDLAHPVRRGFVAAVPIGLLLLVTIAVATGHADAPGVAALWWFAALAELAVTVWVLSAWLAPAGRPGAGVAWPGVTPVLFIPIVGNVLVPLAGVSLGATEWALAQFGVGLLFWPLATVLVFVRLGQAGPLPPRLMPSWFILVAPPAVVGLASGVFGAPSAFAWMAWGVATFFLAWTLPIVPRLLRLPFAIPHWATSFPVAAYAALSLKLAAQPGGGWLAAPALALLAVATVLVVALSVATLAGLVRGTLLVPEPPPAPPTAR